MGEMYLIEENPFRILGLKSTATERELVKRVSDLEIFTSLGVKKKFESDLQVLSIFERTSINIKDAYNKIEQPLGKFYHSLWWFSINNELDKVAFEILKTGNFQKSLNAWQEGIQHSEISITNFTNFKNYALLSIWMAFKTNDDSLLKIGLLNYAKIISNNFFAEYNDQNHNHVNIEIIEKSIDFFLRDLYEAINNPYSNQLSVSKQSYLQMIENFPVKSFKNLRNQLISEPLQIIEQLIHESYIKRTDTPQNAIEIGQNLGASALKHLKLLSKLILVDSVEYSVIADKTAEELFDCSITYFNYHINNDSDLDPGEESLKLAEFALEIANGANLKKRIQDSIPVVEDWINSKENRALSELVKEHNEIIINEIENLYNHVFPTIRTIKNMLNTCETQLNIIKSKLGESNPIYTDASDAIVNSVLTFIIALINLAQSSITSQSDINNLIYQTQSAYPILLSLNTWSMSDEVRHKYNENLRIIESMISKLISPNKRKAPNQNDSCYIATMVYGDINHPKVTILRSFRDNHLSKNLFGNVLIKIYYALSPKFVNYTKSYTQLHKYIRQILDSTLIKWYR